MVIDAVLATEDAGFYELPGVEHRAIARAAAANVRRGRDVGITTAVASAQRHGLVWSPNLDGCGDRGTLSARIWADVVADGPTP